MKELGIRGGGKGHNIGLGNLTSLKPVIIASSVEETKKSKPKVPKTRIIRISEPMYLRFVGFSRRYYNVESYETILENLIKCYEEHNKDRYWYHNIDK
jgi:hypothetical protein